jgi:hypothetical protein
MLNINIKNNKILLFFSAFSGFKLHIETAQVRALWTNPSGKANYDYFIINI